MKTLISIDPGQSSGLICGTYSDAEPFRVTHAFQIEGGVEGFVKSVRMLRGDYGEYGTLAVGDLVTYPSSFFDLWEEGFEGKTEQSGTVLVEKFNARGSANSGFSYTSKSLEPLRVEGALIAMGVPITWVQPPQQYFLPGKSKAEKKKRQHAWLKENGLYIAPKDVGCSDADDARSALAHCISYLRRQRHAPTMDLFRKDEDD